ncbi:hypothetical protein P153DRAFT_363614 [Dothidotthia symphoricarpi CBS 119687]|uniref:Uncharacterized protein n=1 Tax=Dothidotthia symphoricarpi CBS 119687 TaxID=1392245 RepID=A0A6A6ARF6_9PLEO|nr:uncharacterized protein P153DRAFT_363614 [Dothidotthia symphoricarpi CBS 119687]KAF2133427.1 hypothetical protein P153DRAFT_363614 [Dothidotthia symphoricarpi CBS 119687]
MLGKEVFVPLLCLQSHLLSGPRQYIVRHNEQVCAMHSRRVSHLPGSVFHTSRTMRLIWTMSCMFPVFAHGGCPALSTLCGHFRRGKSLRCPTISLVSLVKAASSLGRSAARCSL